MKSTELPVQFDENGFALGYGRVLVYCASELTREYIGTKLERTFDGVSLSAGAYLDAPKLPKSDNVAICRAPDGKSWIHVPDYREKTAYHTETREKIFVDYIGELEPVHTLLVPQTPFDNWDGVRWITDSAALKFHQIQQAEQQKLSLQQQADIVIKPLQDAVDLDMAIDDEKSALTEWRKYRVLLNRVDCSTAPDIPWPEQPK
ncbi:tail fiber assembly protein [Xenorhabdus griffiniae]|uniref:tail fiber assembly protein n=1 Tax=Xenorhabdus griffiniae TaxID=351672 RepID=UPI0030D40ED8